jgi:hypothetical protein
MHRATTLMAAVLLGAALALGSATSALACTCPTVTDNQCIDLGATGAGSPYWLGHACWSTSNRNWGGADCSGFLIKSWQVPRSSRISEDYHPYGTSTIFTTAPHWYKTYRVNLCKADAIGYPPPAGQLYGHVIMWYFGDKNGVSYVLEATGSRIQAHYRDISGGQWQFRRRHNLIQTPGPA